MHTLLQQDTYVVTGIIQEVHAGPEILYDALLPYHQVARAQFGRLLDTETGLAWEPPAGSMEAAGLQLQEFISRYAINRDRPRSEKAADLSRHGGYHRLKVRSHKRLAGQGEFWLIELVGMDNAGNPVSLNDLMLSHGFVVPASV